MSVRWSLGALGLLACTPADVELATRPRDLYVAPTGDDAASGREPQVPLRRVQTAIDRALPGDVIHLSPGRYDEDLTTVRDGRAEAPITLTGPRDAVVVGAGGARVVQVEHDHVTLQGFSIDGLAGADANARASYRDKLVYAQGTSPRAGVTGLRVVGMRLANAGGECVRLRYFAVGNELRDNDVGPCGLYDFRFGGGSENGQGIYVGTALEQLADGKNPTPDRDESTDNVVRDNRIRTAGAECIALKEAADRNVVSGNVCSGTVVRDSAGLDVRSSGNRVTGNELYDHAGAGLRLGGASDRDGIDNDVTANAIHDNAGAALRAMRGPQRRVCGNALSANRGGDVEGDAATGVVPSAPCP